MTNENIRVKKQLTNENNQLKKMTNDNIRVKTKIDELKHSSEKYILMNENSQVKQN